MTNYLKINQAVGDENSGHLISSKQLFSARKHSVKKQAFGEIRNALNRNDATPFIDGRCKPKCEPFNKLSEKKVAAAPKVCSAAQLSIELELLDHMDMPQKCCSGNSYKTQGQIWSEMNALDNEVLNRVLKGGDPDSDDEFDFDEQLWDQCGDYTHTEQPNLPSVLGFTFNVNCDTCDEDFGGSVEIPSFEDFVDDLPLFSY